MSEASRVRALVSGVVQGVGFRYFAVGEARDRGLTGWVRNRYDGSVEVLVEGEEGLVREFVQRLRVGPPSSRVTAVNTSNEPFAGEFNTFAVRH